MVQNIISDHYREEIVYTFVCILQMESVCLQIGFTKACDFLVTENYTVALLLYSLIYTRPTEKHTSSSC